MTAFTVVKETEAEAPKPASENHDKMTAELMALLFKGLSQKALVAASHLFTLLALFSAWWLWDTVLPNPTAHQLIGVALYAVFLLALEIVRRKR